MASDKEEMMMIPQLEDYSVCETHGFMLPNTLVNLHFSYAKILIQVVSLKMTLIFLTEER